MSVGEISMNSAIACWFESGKLSISSHKRVKKKKKKNSQEEHFLKCSFCDSLSDLFIHNLVAGRQSGSCVETGSQSCCSADATNSRDAFNVRLSLSLLHCSLVSGRGNE